MAIVNKFNVNKQEVTLNPDIIENMSANDVSYDTSFKYDENTVGDKLSKLEYDVTGIKDVTRDYISINTVELVTGGISYIDGSDKNSDSKKRTNYLPVKRGDVIYYIVNSFNSVYGFIAYYDINKTFVSNLINYSSDVKTYGGAVTVPDDGYVRISSNYDKFYFDINRTVSLSDAFEINKTFQVEYGGSMLKGTFVRCGSGGIVNIVNTGRVTNYDLIKYDKDVTLVALEGYKFNITYYDPDGTNPSDMGWQTKYTIDKGQYFRVQINCIIEGHSYTEPKDFLKGVYVVEKAIEYTDGLLFKSLSELGYRTINGYYQSDGTINTNLFLQRLFTGCVLAPKGTTVKIISGTFHQKGIVLFQYDENWNFISSIGDINSTKEIESEYDGFLGIYVLFDEDVKEHINEACQQILIRFPIKSTIDQISKTALLKNDVDFINKSMEKGEYTYDTIYRASSSDFIKVGAGTKIIVTEYGFSWAVHFYDLWSKKYIEDTGQLSNWSYTIPYDCYIKIWCRNVLHSDVDLSVRLEDLKSIFMFNLRPVTTDASESLPSYYFEDNYITNEVSEIKSKYSDCGYSGDIFAFITDVHWQQNPGRSPLMLMYLMRNTALKRIVFGGDAITDGKSKEEALKMIADFRNVFRFVNGDKWLPIIGNHELNDPGASKPSLRLNISQAYAALIKEQEGIITPIDPYVSYWDNKPQKIRYYLVGLTYTSGFSSSSTTAFLSSLHSVEDGWSVIVCSHGGLNGKSGSEEAIDSVLGGVIGGVDAAANKTSIQYNDQSYDFSSKNISIVCMLSGHTHKQSVLASNGGVNIIVCPTDGGVESGGLTRGVGTINENAFEVVEIDKTNKIINLIRIGAGNNRFIHYDVNEVVVNNSTTLISSLSGTLTWTSKNTNIATVSSNTVTGVASGYASIYASNENGEEEYFVVKVI